MSSVEESLHFMALSLSVFGCIISSSLRLHVTCGKAHAAIGFIWSCRPSPHPTMKIALVSSMFVLQYLLVHPSTSKYFSIYIYNYIHILTYFNFVVVLIGWRAHWGNSKGSKGDAVLCFLPWKQGSHWHSSHVAETQKNSHDSANSYSFAPSECCTFHFIYIVSSAPRTLV